MQAFLDIFDIYLLEAVVNGILLGGVLALLALGLNLIFGVIDVTWICYAELVMIGMYGMYYMVQVFGMPYWAAATVNAGDFKGLRKLADAARDNLKLGIVLYDGDGTVPFGDRMFAAPVSCLWG